MIESPIIEKRDDAVPQWSTGRCTVDAAPASAHQQRASEHEQANVNHKRTNDSYFRSRVVGSFKS